jgi:acyl-coenzyme A thioesterase PaaI-like protein
VFSIGHYEHDLTLPRVPHGGFVTSCIQSAAHLHFSTTLRGRNQPHALTLHLEFLRRTAAGPATITFRDAKLGQQTSTLQFSITQPSPSPEPPRECVVGLITHSNLSDESGVTLATDWALDPPPPPVSIPRLRNNEDENWYRIDRLPFASFRKAMSNVFLHHPRAGQVEQCTVDEWLRFRSGERFTNNSIGFVADAFSPMVNVFGSHLHETTNSGPDAEKRTGAAARYWFPTLVLNLEVKKALPEEGVEWLFVRVRAKQIRNGRMDLEVVILDEGGDLVALSHHVSFIVPVSRNTAKIGAGESKKGPVKL